MIITVIILMILTVRCSADAIKYPDPVEMYTTAYTAEQGSITASGCHVRTGICAAKEEWMGKVAVIYSTDYELLGIYEILDTGFGGDADGDGIGSIQEGKCIDVFMETDADMRIWMKRTGGKCLVQIIDGKG
ncbi:MAG: hypothetical protein PHP50_14265 [Lachnospiraceae bacterium]|nr:hypothetical protein [Lachnospiraceae bacterium]